MTQEEIASGRKKLARRFYEKIKLVEAMQNEAKRDIAEDNLQINRIHEHKNKRLIDLKLYGAQRLAIEAEKAKALNEYDKVHEGGKRALEDYSDWALMREMNKRGYRGELSNANVSDEKLNHMYNILNKEAKPTPPDATSGGSGEAEYAPYEEGVCQVC